MQVSHMYVRLNMHLISWHKSDLNLLILQQSLTNKYSVQYDLTADFCRTSDLSLPMQSYAH